MINKKTAKVLYKLTQPCIICFGTGIRHPWAKNINELPIEYWASLTCEHVKIFGDDYLDSYTKELKELKKINCPCGTKH